LEESTTEELLHGSNRVRPSEFVALFKRHGFEVVAFMPFETIDVPTKLRDQFIEPFRSMSADVLSVIGARLLVRKL
jgi:uroporphyrinogen-III synthase